MPKVSIIIPVYNVEKYLRKCLDSVINQTLKDIEIICIDDKSTDNSLQILKEYAAKDNRFKILEQDNNQGQGIARNRGLDIANGEYIAFVDPDDYIELDMYETMYNLVFKNNCDVVFCNYDRYYTASEKLEIANKFEEYNINVKPLEIFNWSKLKSNVLQNIPYICVNKLIKKDLLLKNNIKFLEYKVLGEDRSFSISVLLHGRKCIYTNEVMYHYIIRPLTSISILPIYPMILINEVLNILKKLNLEKELEIEFDNFKKDLFIESYNREYDENLKRKILLNAKKELSKNLYSYFKKSIKEDNFLQKIFSLRNRNYPNIKKRKKLLTIFGFNIVIREEDL